MYPLLPTMQNVNYTLIKQVMDELAQLYREDEITLSQQFIWMKLLLDRTDTIPGAEKEKIQAVLSIYDRLWEENPRVQKLRTDSIAEGEAKGIAQAVALVVKARFPQLLELALQKTKQVQQSSELDLLVQELAVAADEDTARRLLIQS